MLPRREEGLGGAQDLHLDRKNPRDSNRSLTQKEEYSYVCAEAIDKNRNCVGMYGDRRQY